MKTFSKNELSALMTILDEHNGIFDDSYNGVVVELFNECFNDTDAAEFMAEWYPECISYAIETLYYDYGASTCALFDEEELQFILDSYECTYEEYEEKYGFIFQDVAFNGYVVMGM